MMGIITLEDVIEKLIQASRVEGFECPNCCMAWARRSLSHCQENIEDESDILGGAGRSGPT